MIRIFYGSPGAGKSFGALKDLVEELAYGERLIVTNLSLDLGMLNAYMQKKFEWWTDDINLRIRVITEDETGEFYSYRTVGMPPLNVPCRALSLAGQHVVYPENNIGVAYYIDEAHIKFDAREWKDAGPELTYYASQHRKLNDEVVLITQHPDMLNNRMRMLCQQFWSFNNHGLERLWTYFSKPAYFTCEVHRRIPQGTFVPPPEEVHRYRLQKDLADCYDTSAGVGIKGRKLPEKKPRLGFSVLWMIIPLAVVVYLLFMVPEWVAKGLVFATTGSEAKISTAVTAAVNPVASTAPTPDRPAAPQLPKTEAPRLPTVKSYVVIRGDAIVTLSDGTVLSRADGVAEITKDHVIMSNGVKYRILRGRHPTEAGPKGRPVGGS